MDYEMIVAGFGTRVVYAVVLVTAAFFLLRWLDHLSGLTFKTMILRISLDPKALALYYSARLLAVFIGLGWLFS
jgi:hypothetical protein